MGKKGNLVTIILTEVMIGVVLLGWWSLFNPLKPPSILDIVADTIILLVGSFMSIFMSYIVWDSCVAEES